VFLKLGSAKGYQGFREKKMRNGRTVLLAVLNLYIRIEIRVMTLSTNHSVTDITQTVSRCFSPEASRLQSSQSAQQAIDTVDVSGETIRLSMGLRLAVDFFLHVTCIRYKQMLAGSFIIDILWTG
jgi:hypothetical protein